MFFFRSKDRRGASREVSQDWVATLTGDKDRLFSRTDAELERAQTIFSVSLDQAITARNNGRHLCSRQHVANASILLERFSLSLLGTLLALASLARHFGVLPSVRSLEPECFRASTSQDAIKWLNLLHTVLFGHRSRFFHALQTLSGLVENLSAEFQDAVDEIVEDGATNSSPCWETLVIIQDDLNTCLQESRIILKSFLLVLPGDKLTDFQAMLEAPHPPAPRRIRPRFSHIAS